MMQNAREMSGAMQCLRLLYPQFRRTRSWAIIHSGGTRTIYGCVCGSQITRATQWPVTKRVIAWMREHDHCAAEVLISGQTPTL